jgi:hypothetical protein
MHAKASQITGHSQSYGGNKYTPEERRSYMKNVFNVRRDNTSVAYQSLHFFGYKTDDWGLEQMV